MARTWAGSLAENASDKRLCKHCKRLVKGKANVASIGDGEYLCIPCYTWAMQELGRYRTIVNRRV